MRPAGFLSDRTTLARFAAPLALLAGAALRLSGLEVHSLWYDEGTTLYVARAADLVETLSRDRHPPLSFLAFRGWTAVGGEGDAWLRLLPALVSCAALALFHAVARHLLAGASTVLAVALMALSPFQIWIGQEVRMYAFVELGTLLALLGTLGRGPRAWALCAGGAFLALGSHYLGGLAVPVALALGAWRAWSGRSTARELRAQGLALALGAGAWIPWLVLVLPRQLATDWGHQLRTSARDLLELPVRLILVELDVLDPAWTAIGYAGGAGILLAVAGAAFAALRDPRGGSAGALILFAVPILTALFAMLAVPPNFTPKYLVVASPGAALAVASGIANLRPRWIGWCSGAAVLLACATIALLLRQGNHREDFRGACADLAAVWRDGDQILVITGTPAGFSEPNVRHYLRDRPELERAVRPWEDYKRDRKPEERLHVVYRSAKYAQAQLDAVASVRPLLAQSLERFAIRWLLFGPEPSEAELREQR